MTAARVAVAVTATEPTAVLPGQASAANCAGLHLGTACGLPTSPGGKRTVRSLVSSVAGLAANEVEIFRSGCPPACVVLGVTLKAVTFTAADADAGNASRATVTASRRSLTAEQSPPPPISTQPRLTPTQPPSSCAATVRAGAWTRHASSTSSASSAGSTRSRCTSTYG